MVKPVEEQMFEVAKERDKDSRRKLQAEWDRDPEKKGRKVPKRKVHKPWSRGIYPKLCQEIDCVETILEYDYDLLDLEFQEYCRMRGVLHVAGTPGSTRWEFCVEHGRSSDEYFETVGRTPLQTDSSEEDPPPPEADSDWRIIRIARGKLQDCWELFRSGGSASTLR